MPADLKPASGTCPINPGSTSCADRLKRVIYVGKARDLRKRLANYFTPSRAARADPKTRALIDSIWDFEVHVVRSEAEAVLYEGRLIRRNSARNTISASGTTNGSCWCG